MYAVHTGSSEFQHESLQNFASAKSAIRYFPHFQTVQLLTSFACSHRAFVALYRAPCRTPKGFEALSDTRKSYIVSVAWSQEEKC